MKVDIILGLMFVAALFMVGSEGPWFPWVNAGGILLMITFAVPLIARENRRRE